MAAQAVVTVGVAIASYGELTFVLMGVILQLIAIGTESTRLILVQILLQVPVLNPQLSLSLQADYLPLHACKSKLMVAGYAEN